MHNLAVRINNHHEDPNTGEMIYEVVFYHDGETDYPRGTKHLSGLRAYRLVGRLRQLGFMPDIYFDAGGVEIVYTK